jgi:hypothetical protein
MYFIETKRVFQVFATQQNRAAVFLCLQGMGSDGEKEGK